MNRLLTSILSLLLCSFSHVTATKFYVSTTGNNSNSGTNPGSSGAFLTIDKALSVAANNDQIYVIAGVYSISGTLNITKPVSLYGMGGVVLDATAWSPAITGKTMMHIFSGYNVRIDGFSFQNLIGDYSVGLLVDGWGTDITIQHCSFSNIGWISNDLKTKPVSGSNNANPVLIHGTMINPISFSLLYDTVSNCATGYSEGITAAGNVDTFNIMHCIVHEISNIGIDIASNTVYSSNAPDHYNYAKHGVIAYNTVYHCMSPISASAGIYLDGAFYSFVVNNLIYENGVGISVGEERSPKSGAFPCTLNYITNNVIYGNAVAGMVLGDTFKTRTYVINTMVANNTFYKNRTGAVINGVSRIGSDTSGTGLFSNHYGNDYGAEILIHNSDSSLFLNNIIHTLGNKHSIVIPDSYTATHLSIFYNDLYKEGISSYIDIGSGASANGFTGIKSYNSINGDIDKHSISVNPAYTNAVNGDFSLNVTSGCINAGDPSSDQQFVGGVDFADHPRIFGGRIDIGAFESQVPLGIESINHVQGFEVGISPNPADMAWMITSNQEIESIRVYNMGGQIVLNSIRPANRLPCTNWPGGLYLIQLTNKKGEQITKRLVKE